MKDDRRNFIKKSAIAAAGIGLGAGHLNAASYSRILGANDRINIGVAGNYRRAQALVGTFKALKDRINMIYTCDVVKERRDKYADTMKETLGYRPKAINDLREILDDRKVDAFFNLLPDHWHAPGTWMALEKGKHVYCEKPLTHNPREWELLIEYQRKFGKIVQMGNQQRSQSTAKKIMGEIHNGLIGDVYSVLAYYSNSRGGIGKGKAVPVPEGFDWDLFQGPAPREQFRDIYFDYNWHWFWTWGTGETGNNATHELDVARWALQVAHPEDVVVSAGKYHFTDDDWVMYDTMDATYRYPGNRTIIWDGKSRNNYQTYGDGRGNIIYGSDGTVTLTRNGYKVFDRAGKMVREESEESMSVTTGLGGGGDITTNHVANFLDALSGKAAQDSVLKEAAASTHLCHLANISYRAGKDLKVDPLSGQFLDQRIMDLYWGREYEPGWEPPVI